MIVPRTEIILTHHDGSIATSVLEPGEYVIGSDPACEIPIAADGVSRQHAKLTINFAETLIEDLGSPNGTIVGGNPVTEAVRLWPGQPVKLGSATLTTRRLKSEAAGGSIMPWTAELRRQLPEELRREGRYAINKLVAQGGMGAILHARDQTIRRSVAMKVTLDPRFGDDMVRFIEEAQVTGQLEHPNIVPIYELGVDEYEQPFYTMKFVRGITLKKVLELLAEGREGTLKKYPLAALLTVFQKVCDAIAFAHSRHVIHRDLKPENVMIGDFGEVLVMDWGLAKTRQPGQGTVCVPVNGGPLPSMIRSARTDSGEHGATMAGTIMGTPNFMAPEQAEGKVDELDARTDIFALGGILYSILTLQLPFSGETVEEVLEKVVSGKIAPPVSYNSGPRRAAHSTGPGVRKTAGPLAHLPGKRVPGALSAVAMKALALRPADRYQTVPELQKDIEAYQGGFATRAERAGTGKQILLLLKRHRAATLGAAAVLLVGAIFGSKALLEGRRAAQTLRELRGTAPVFAAQARALLAEGKLEDALAKIGYAVTLAPDDPDLRLTRAHLLQSTQRFAEAGAEYRAVLTRRPDDASARLNLGLSEHLLAAKGGEATLPLKALNKLLDGLIAQHRDLEAAPLSLTLKRDANTNEATLRARLSSYSSPEAGTPYSGSRARRFGRFQRMRSCHQPLTGIPQPPADAKRGLT